MRRAYAFTRPVPNTYLSRERDRRRRRELTWILLAVLPVGFCGLLYVWLHFQVLDTGYRILRLEKRLEESRQIERELRLEASYLSAPERIEARARDELGLGVASLDQIVFEGELE